MFRSKTILAFISLLLVIGIPASQKALAEDIIIVLDNDTLLSFGATPNEIDEQLIQRGKHAPPQIREKHALEVVGKRVVHKWSSHVYKNSSTTIFLDYFACPCPGGLCAHAGASGKRKSRQEESLTEKEKA